MKNGEGSGGGESRGEGASASCEVRLLSFRVLVQGPESLVKEFRSLRPEGPAWASPSASESGDANCTFHVQPDPLRRGRLRVMRGADPTVVATASPLNMVAALDRAVNGAAVEYLAERYLLVHAGAVAYGGQGILVPAASGSGKTTLIAALVAAGCEYLSDEVAVLDLITGRLLPFPKCLGIKAGGRRVLVGRYPALRGKALRHWINGEAVWLLPPPEAAWPAAPVPVRHIVLPRYIPRTPPTMVPISRSTALAAVAAQCHRPQVHGAASVGGLVAVLRDADCHSMSTGDLGRSVELVLRLLAA